MKDPNELGKLLSDISICQICASAMPVEPRPVVQAHPDAKILIAGQAPGRRVFESGIPFDDPSGDRLRDWTGMSKDIFYDATTTAIVPMGFCYPGKGKSGDLPPRKECAATWHVPLMEQLSSIEMVVAIGAYAIKYHLKAERGSLTEIVRRWEKFYPAIIPLPHPSPRNVGWFMKNPWFEDEVVPALRKRVAEVLRR